MKGVVKNKSAVVVKSKSAVAVKNKFRDYEFNNNYKLLESARKGVRPQAFYDFAFAIKMPDKNLAQIIHLSPRTISNYKESRKNLDPVQSEHLLKLIALFDKGEEIFGTIDEFNYWLQKPFWHSMEKPMDWLITPGGTDLVMEELNKLAYGDVI